MDRIEYYSLKSAAIKRLKNDGWQREDRCKDAWFKYAPWGRNTFSARIVRAPKETHKGLWAIAFEG
jgi:hypothetical protein